MIQGAASTFMHGVYVKQVYTPDSLPDVGATMLTLSSKKWRRTALDEESRIDTLEKIRRSVDDACPLRFSLPFGGYKCWDIGDAPHPNNAEVLLLDHLRSLGEQLLRSHPFGVDFCFSYASGVVSALNNIEEADQLRYLGDFAGLLEFFSSERVRFSLFDVASLYSPGEMYAEIQDHLAQHANAWEAGFLDNEKRVASARRNLARVGVSDFTALGDDDWEVEVRSRAQFCEAVDSLSRRRWFNKYSDRIQLVFVRGPRPSVHIGSCRTSTMHPWMGYGLLEVGSHDIYPRIVGMLPADASFACVDVPEEVSALLTLRSVPYVSRLS